MQCHHCTSGCNLVPYHLNHVELNLIYILNDFTILMPYIVWYAMASKGVIKKNVN